MRRNGGIPESLSHLYQVKQCRRGRFRIYQFPHFLAVNQVDDVFQAPSVFHPIILLRLSLIFTSVNSFKAAISSSVFSRLGSGRPERFESAPMSTHSGRINRRRSSTTYAAVSKIIIGSIVTIFLLLHKLTFSNHQAPFTVAVLKLLLPAIALKIGTLLRHYGFSDRLKSDPPLWGIP
jgi:hypothetical protein